MKTIEEIFPETAKGEFWISNYTALLEGFEYEILLKVDDDNYSGDSRVIFKNGDQYGLLIFGWGSCSGCDALQSCNTIEEIEELRDSLHNDIIWNDCAGLLKFINERDWELQYSWYEEKTKEFVDQAKELLGKILESN